MARPTRPTRPSAAKAVAQKLEKSKPIRLVIEIQPKSRHGLRKRAANLDTTIKAYLLGLALSDGADLDPTDVPDG